VPSHKYRMIGMILMELYDYYRFFSSVSPVLRFYKISLKLPFTS
jgi:hypothetical protein